MTGQVPLSSLRPTARRTLYPLRQAGEGLGWFQQLTRDDEHRVERLREALDG